MATPNKNLALPVFASSLWNVPVNSNFSITDAAVSGVQPINLAAYAGGPIVLTSTFPVVSSPLTSLSYIPAILAVSGALVQNVVITIPSGITGIWLVANYTSGAFTVTISSGGGGTSVICPRSVVFPITSDGTNIIEVGVQSAAFTVGDYKESASPAPQTGWQICYGQAISRTTYAALFAAIGTTYGTGDGSTTFNVPDCRGRIKAGADNMGGTAAGVLTGYTIGTTGGVQSSAIGVVNLPAHNHGVTDPGHTHGVTDPGHAHGPGAGVYFVNYSATVTASTIQDGGGASFYWTPTTATATAVTGITVNSATTGITTQNTGSGTLFSLVQPTIAAYVFIYAGV
jgi:microcystin-dependent protein